MVYNDSKDRIIASTNRSKLQVGDMGHLMVVSQTKIGSFLDWGLEKDLFLPFSETVGSIEKGKSYLVGVYLDKSDRICATMKIKDMLSTESPYKENDKVSGTIYSINRDIGAFVAVDDKYDGLIPKKELLGAYEVGDNIEVRISKVKEDGKLDLSLRDRSYVQMDEDSKVILSKLKEQSGFLALNDNSPPEEIKKQLKMSKSGFKRAVGRLYKEGIIELKDNGIKFK
jgi:predicted RNA-binding protein (virulence factor B family)